MVAPEERARVMAEWAMGALEEGPQVGAGTVTAVWLAALVGAQQATATMVVADLEAVATAEVARVTARWAVWAACLVALTAEVGATVER